MELPVFKETIFHMPTKIVLGIGKAQSLIEEITSEGLNNLLLVADPGIMELKRVKDLIENIINKGFLCAIFNEIEPNPSSRSVEKGAKIAKEFGVDSVIAIGGGSAIDVAKGIALCATNEGSVLDYSRIGNKKITVRPLPLFALPTTSGTGSEVTHVSVITDKTNLRKIVIASPWLYPKTSILDPLLVQSLPPNLTAFTGMDALTHAIEAYVTLKNGPITDSLAIKAISLIAKYLGPVVANGDNIEARTHMMTASCMAGMAFANSGLGIVHSTAHSLGGVINLGHGVANAVMLPYCMEYNLVSNPEKFVNIALALGQKVNDLSLHDAAFKAIKAVKKLTRSIGINERLSNLGVKREMLEGLANKALTDVGTIPNNPRKPSFEDLLKIFEKAF